VLNKTLEAGSIIAALEALQYLSTTVVCLGVGDCYIKLGFGNINTDKEMLRAVH
jgi:hypothetical protein